MRFDLTINEFAKKVYFNEKFEIYHVDTWRPYLNLDDLSLIVGKSLKVKNLITINMFLILAIVKKIILKDKLYTQLQSYCLEIRIINLLKKIILIKEIIK